MMASQSPQNDILAMLPTKLDCDFREKKMESNDDKYGQCDLDTECRGTRYCQHYLNVSTMPGKCAGESGCPEIVDCDIDESMNKAGPSKCYDN
jgi:hypothetical protein